MERLTYNDDGCWQVHGADENICKKVCEDYRYCKSCPIGRAIDRLAEYEDTGLTVERAKELGKADSEGRVVTLRYPVKPLVWGDDEHETILCPTCGHDLMGEFRDGSAGYPIMYQCCHCGESVDTKMVISREEAEKALEAAEE